MGFGSDPAGAGPAGIDLPATTAQRIAATPPALQVDGLTKNFILDSYGRFVAAHPIDAKVFNRLRIRKLSIKSAPSTGNNVPNRRYIDASTEAFVRDEVATTLRDMIDSGEIRDDGVEIDLSVRGRIMYRYRYVNLHTGKRQTYP